MNPNELETLARETVAQISQIYDASSVREFDNKVEVLLNFAAKVQAASGAEVRRLITDLIPKTWEYVSIVDEYGGSIGYADTQTTKKLREILTVIDTAAPAKDAGAREETELTLATPKLIEIAARAIWQQHMNKLETEEQTQWDDAPPLGRGITMAYAENALLAIDNARRAEGRKL